MERRTLLFLLLFMCLQAASESAVFNKDKITPMPCQVIQPFDSQLVRAYHEKEVRAEGGCITNATRPSSGAEVHILSHHSNDSDQDIELILKDFNEEGFAKPFIVILSSNVRTHWQIRLGRHVRDPSQHLFVVSKTSGIRFTNKHLKSRLAVSKVRGLPTGTAQLWQWADTKYGAVTSLTSYDAGNSFTLTIGRASSKQSPPSTTSSSSSPPQSTSPSSQCNIQAPSPAPFPTKGIARQHNNVAGCLVDSRQYTDSDLNYAYVVEMNFARHRKKPVVVDVDLRLAWNATEKVEFWLVLKSSSPVKWRVNARHSEGYIIFVSNHEVDDKGVHIMTTAVRQETLEESGAELLHWVTVHLGRVAMYTRVNDSNKIRLTLPQIASPKSKPFLPTPPAVAPGWSIEQTLKRALRTSCTGNSVTVAIDNNVLEMFRIKSSTVSLMDPRCRAQKNNTHVYIESERGTCGTKAMRTPQGEIQFMNILVLQSTGTVMEDRHGYGSFHDADLVEDGGSGQDDIFSGSGNGDIPSDLVLDDEDLAMRPMHIGFTCSVVAMETTTGRQAEPMFQLELFHSSFYLNPYARFPVDLPDAATRLYLQATVTFDPTLQANFEHCWLSSVTETLDNHKYMLLQNGCIVDGTMKWDRAFAPPQSERFSFTLENFVLETSSSQGVFLKCQMTVCCLESQCSGHRYPQCLSPRQSTCNRYRSRHTTTPSRLVVLGPIMLPQSTGGYEVKSTVSVNQETESVGEVGSGKLDKQDQVVIEGLDSGTVIGIAFAAFIIGVLMMGALWFIHTHSGSIFTSGPFKRSLGNRGSSENEADYGETTPGSSAPISA